MHANGLSHVVADSSCREIEKLICYHRQGHEVSNSCNNQDNSSYYTIMFGAVQVMLSQIPDMHNMGWLSIFATIMSFSYATIGFALGFAQVLGKKVRNLIFFVTYLVCSKWTISYHCGDS